ncbi:unnamed protein product [Microthlaspi erraticum]|uniref:Peptidase C19 ubiquitin carboxyl-terminal hydrolase domain-containing protein n=1 Tax=Microthlaspi erraticum TaxID=1685480 RepID=A0A6D2IDH3_9BRAS|nr:unnamed protein product [Microthlaspi erraticum]CAA7055747.1 unnamed protein product [Microthlaspi erraticum]
MASSSDVPESEKVKQIDHEIDPDDLSETQENSPMKHATCVLALNTILKSLMKIRVFISHVKLAICQETHEGFTKYLLSLNYHDFLSELSRNPPLEENGVSEILVTVLNLLPDWNHDFVFDSGFEHFSFEKMLYLIKYNLRRVCKCEKQSRVQRLIEKLPSVFTIVLQWEKNETEQEIYETVSALATEMDISEIYKYEEGHCPDTKYHLVSMVCAHGDQFSCVALENYRWVRYFGNEEEVIGNWDTVLSMFMQLNMRPEIVFFENAVKREKIVNDQIDTKVALEWKLAQRDWFSQLHLLELQAMKRNLAEE